MKRKPTSCSSAGFERLFGLFGVFAYDREACRGLGAKAFGPSRRFPAWLAPTSPRDAQRDTSKQAVKWEEHSVDLSSERREEREKERKREKNHRSCVAKSGIHRKRGGENGQTDPLDGRTQVEDKLRRERAVSSSDPQTEGLGKHG